ncbi:MAG: Co2+/Mg2+ efflux protein ApaG [Betaproteobacteria bacterium]|jgi:ApaG protein|uniref:Protein ApaG n=1 Tax=Thiomonas delicata TaxID=364030 RepID=A0A238D0V5_THIDL|nr:MULTISPECIES: Co2+/Mg2+ efflux protein ApaG [Thiomonas]MDE2130141.1 Co2+/Mg2+ efflux protein ApaG [Betaproteobacteria bacterium]OZB45024.1 MAG: Co2+/Mg2+ efflux protein ApaG [Thiomonas sp. 15-66-11]OZB51753.1 MAG: Co2+/Mg2+ efflux protein ApaG [Thiomonas sp. 14-66-4]OZB63920.1 MAG: Co2+/Mg2+ efflux protein ApaG [Thiomonas sp. 13-66-29]SBP86882.1 Protein ApaG [Thiomonas delicata]
MEPYQFSVAVKPEFLPEQSDPGQRVWAYSYSVSIRNTGSVAAQLISRHWFVMDETGRVEEVQGLGVVGHQPLLKPGETFEYTSWTRLNTPSGSMRGSYFCVAEDGARFDAPIPEFVLMPPGMTLH